MTAAVQTLWAELVVASLADAGVKTCVVSPGSRSSPLVAALVKDGRFDLPTIIDERAASFFALGAARATGIPAAMLCTSGTAGAHYLPAIIEASHSSVPIIAVTADRPPELQQCGASQTIDQIDLYGRFVRGAFDLGAPVASDLALRAVRRKLTQAVMLSLGPRPGPVHVDVPLRKPLEPVPPSTDHERELSRVVAELRQNPCDARPPRLAPERSAVVALAAAIAQEPEGIIVAGAMPIAFAAERDRLFALARRVGYPVFAEASSQLRFGNRPHDLTAIDHFDLEFGRPPRLVLQLGAEPVAASWPRAIGRAERWVLAGDDWRDPDSSARAVIVGDVTLALDALADQLATVVAGPRRYASSWSAVQLRVAAAIDRAIAAHPRSETAVARAAIEAAPDGTLVQIGNSLPIRVVDQAVRGGGAQHPVLSQRGAAGIDGLVASAAGATRAGSPVLLLVGDVSFAHDLGALLATREACAPLAIVVVDNGGGRIFAGLPIAKAGLDKSFERHFVTAPAIDPPTIATALGIGGVTAATPLAVAAAVIAALATRGTTVIHAPVSASGAQDVRRAALELLATPAPTIATGGSHG